MHSVKFDLILISSFSDMICKHMLLSQKCVLCRDITEVEEMLTGAKGTTQAPDFLWGWRATFALVACFFFSICCDLG